MIWKCKWNKKKFEIKRCLTTNLHNAELKISLHCVDRIEWREICLNRYMTCTVLDEEEIIGRSLLWGDAFEHFFLCWNHEMSRIEREQPMINIKYHRFIEIFKFKYKSYACYLIVILHFSVERLPFHSKTIQNHFETNFFLGFFLHGYFVLLSNTIINDNTRISTHEYAKMYILLFCRR